MSDGSIGTAPETNRFSSWWYWQRERLSFWMKHKRQRIAEALVTRILRWGASDSNMVGHAERELGPVGGKDGPDLWMHDHLLAMVRLFSLEGHSGASASIARGMLNQLLDFKPLGPLTGEEHEWLDRLSLSGNDHQNRRCGRVFLNRETGIAHDIDGFVFREPDGCTFTGRESFRAVRFPYHPETTVVDVPKDSSTEQRIGAIRDAGVPDEDIWCLVVPREERGIDLLPENASEKNPQP